jgi:adenosine kinase
MNIVLSGSIAIDRIMLYDGRFADVIKPEKLHVLSLSVLLKELRETHGGVAANIAYTLSLLGEKPILYGSVGTNAREYMDLLATRGIDTSLVHYSKLPTATFSVITDKADCQVGGFYPGAMSDASGLSIKEFADQDVFVVISPHDPDQMAVQVEECKKMKKKYFYDVGQQVSNISGKDLRAGIDGASLLITNDYEMGVIEEKTGWSHDEILAKVETVVVTLGEKGSTVWYKGKKESVSSYMHVKVLDPTGAGDAFRAGFLFGYLRGVEPEACAKLGSISAAFCIESHGTQEHFFTKDQFKERYKQQFGVLNILE